MGLVKQRVEKDKRESTPHFDIPQGVAFVGTQGTDIAARLAYGLLEQIKRASELAKIRKKIQSEPNPAESDPNLSQPR